MHTFVVGAVAVTEQPADVVEEEVQESVRSLVESAFEATPRISVAIGVIVVGYVGSRVLRLVLRRIFARRRSPSFAIVMSKFAGWVLLSFFVLAASAVAFPSVQPVDLLAGLGFFSIAIGFAFQDVLENTLSGVLLLLRQPFSTGDQIRVQEQEGTVEGITIRETRIRAFDGTLVVIPNRDVYKNVIQVLTHYADRRMSFVVGTAYENDPGEAVEVILGALSTVSDIADHPPPEAFVSELGTSTVNIDVRFWCAPTQLDALRTLSDAMLAAKGALEDAEIEMPADIVVLQASPSFKAAVQGDEEVTPGGGVRHRSA